MSSDFPNNPPNELEARLTALLLGELPENEATALRHEISANPELAKLHDQLSHTIGLVREATTSATETTTHDPALKLSDDRREKLLGSFKVVHPRQLRPNYARLFASREWMALAAMVVALAILAAVVFKDQFERIGMTQRGRSAYVAFLPNRSQAAASDEVEYINGSQSGTTILSTTVNGSREEGHRPYVAGTYVPGSRWSSSIEAVPAATPEPAAAWSEAKIDLNGRKLSKEQDADAPSGVRDRELKSTVGSSPTDIASRESTRRMPQLPHGVGMQGGSAPTQKSDPRSSRGSDIALPQTTEALIAGEKLDDLDAIVAPKQAEQLFVTPERNAFALTPPPAAEPMPQPPPAPPVQHAGENTWEMQSRAGGRGFAGGGGGGGIGGGAAPSRQIRTGSAPVSGPAANTPVQDLSDELGYVGVALAQGVNGQAAPAAGGQQAIAGGYRFRSNFDDAAQNSPLQKNAESGKEIAALDSFGREAKREDHLAQNPRPQSETALGLLWKTAPAQNESSNPQKKLPEGSVSRKSTDGDSVDFGGIPLFNKGQAITPGAVPESRDKSIAFSDTGVDPAKDGSLLGRIDGRIDITRAGDVSGLATLAYSFDGGAVSNSRVSGFDSSSWEVAGNRAEQERQLARLNATNGVYSVNGVGFVNGVPQDGRFYRMKDAKGWGAGPAATPAPVVIDDIKANASTHVAGIVLPQLGDVAQKQIADQSSSGPAHAGKPVVTVGAIEQLAPPPPVVDPATGLPVQQPAERVALQPEVDKLATIVAPTPVIDPATGLPVQQSEADRFSSVSEVSSDQKVVERALRLRVQEGTAEQRQRLAQQLKKHSADHPEVLQAKRELAEEEKKLKEGVAGRLKPVAEADLEKLEEDTKKQPQKPSAPASAPIPQPEIYSADNPFSTFSLNVSDVSFKLAEASLQKGALPDSATIRSEEFINAFDYRDPEPAAGKPVAFAWDRARYPFAHNRDLLRFSLKTAAIGRQAGRPVNLVLLLDNSGSMERADRVRIIQQCLRVLATQLRPEDRVSVIAFARAPRLWVDGLPGNKAGELEQSVGSLTPQGGTNLEEGMNLAYQTALRHYLANGINRVVLLTDGAANLGDVEPQSLKQKVEDHRKQGIALDCFGIGWEGYNDDLLEQLSRNGDGRYGFVNTPEAAATEFAGQLVGALQVAASDVKVQVEFNPKRVTSYRQIGYAKHQLQKEQFRDNTVDAAEIAAAEAGNALYVVQVNPRGEGPLGVVRVRYKTPGTTEYFEHEWAVPFSGGAVPALEEAAPAMRLAGVSAAFSEWLASSPYAGEVKPDALLRYLSGVPESFGADPRPRKLDSMIRQSITLAGAK